MIEIDVGVLLWKSTLLKELSSKRSIIALQSFSWQQS